MSEGDIDGLMQLPSNGARAAFPWTRHRSLHATEEINARWQITAYYHRCMYVETQCSIARKTTHPAANSPSPCNVPFGNRILDFVSLQWKCVCSLSIDCRTRGRWTRTPCPLSYCYHWDSGMVRVLWGRLWAPLGQAIYTHWWTKGNYGTPCPDST